MPYNHRSPFIYQHTYSTRRPIGQVAEVKGVFIKEAQGVRKVEKAFVQKRQFNSRTNSSISICNLSGN